MFARRPFKQIAIALLITLLSPSLLPAVAQTFSDLPDIGDPAASALPLSREKKLGEVFVRGLRSQLPIVQDIEVNEYVSSIGSQLTNAHPNIQMKFHFLLIRNPSINAFATIGGVIALNSGLMLTAPNESQFASVMAHEIGHVTQRHIARMLAQYQDFNWTNALAILSIIVATAYDSDVGQLGLFTSSALPIDQQLAYSRSHEIESDRVGIRLMQGANIDPIGMSKFFSLLQLHEGRAGSSVPEFVRTHPLTIDRINHALSYSKHSNKRYREDSLEFQFARARLAALLSPHVALQITSHGKHKDIVTEYRRGVALALAQRPKESAQALRQITNGEDNLQIQLALAQAEILQGNHAAAVRVLQRLNTLYPRRETVNYYLSLALLKYNKPTAALSALQPFANSNQHPLTKKLLAEITAKLGEEGISYEYLADYYEENGRISTALKHLKKAEKSSQGHVFLARVKVKRAKLEQLKKDLENPLP